MDPTFAGPTGFHSGATAMSEGGSPGARVGKRRKLSYAIITLARSHRGFAAEYTSLWRSARPPGCKRRTEVARAGFPGVFRPVRCGRLFPAIPEVGRPEIRKNVRLTALHLRLELRVEDTSLTCWGMEQRPQGWALSTSRTRSYSMFTARAARSAIVTNDMDACTIIRVLAQRESTGTSVGEKAVLVLKARNR